MGKTALVLGGGIGGVVAAGILRRRLAREHRVVLVDLDGRHVFSPSLPWFVCGTREPARFTRDLGRLARRGIEVVIGEVTAIDAARPSATVNGEVLAADYLVLALGSELAHGAVPGWKPAALNFFCLRGATMVREALATFTGGKVAIAIASTPFKCPAAPYEMAMLLADRFRRLGMRDRVEIDVYTPEPLPLPVAGAALGEAVRGLLEERGIRFHPARRLERIDGDSKRMRFAEGEPVPFDLLLGIPPHRPPAPVREAGLTGPTGWVPVERHTLRAAPERVWAIGDLAAIPIAGGMALPKAGVFAERQAGIVAHNLADAIEGTTPRRRFEGAGECFIETGSGRAGFARGDFYAEPAPAVAMERPGRRWHALKALHEWRWLRRWL
jgi:sulfide:quinone oxidoreductase